MHFKTKHNFNVGNNSPCYILITKSGNAKRFRDTMLTYKYQVQKRTDGFATDHSSAYIVDPP